MRFLYFFDFTFFLVLPFKNHPIVNAVILAIEIPARAAKPAFFIEINKMINLKRILEAC